MVGVKNLKLRPILNSIDSKLFYIIMYSHQSIKNRFTVVMNQKVLTRYDFVKYLGDFINKS